MLPILPRMLCATAKGQGSAAVVNRICQGISAGACAMGRVALLRAPRPHGHAPLMHGRGEFRWVARQQFWALRELCARVEPRARSPRLGPSAPDRGVRAGSREPRCAYFFLCQGAVPVTHPQNLLQCRCGTGPYTYVQALPEFMHAFGGAGNHTQGRQPLGLARSTVKPHKPGGSVNTLDAGWQPRRHDQLRTPAHV